MLAAAGFEVLGARHARVDLAPPLSPAARRFVVGQLRRSRDGAVGSLDADDRATLDVLVDADDERSVMRRPDVFVAASRQIVIARPSP
jgi:hypothetical protein